MRLPQFIAFLLFFSCTLPFLDAADGDDSVGTGTTINCVHENDAYTIFAAPGQNVAVEVGFKVNCLPPYSGVFNYVYACDYSDSNPAFTTGVTSALDCSTTPTRLNITCNYVSDLAEHEILIAILHPDDGSTVDCKNPIIYKTPYVFLSFQSPEIPQISNLKIRPTHESAEISWSTGILTSVSNLMYGPSLSGMSEYAQPRDQQGTYFDFTLDGLSAQTQYFYNATSCNENGVPFVCNSTIGSFTTNATPAINAPAPSPSAGPSSPSYLLMLDVAYPSRPIPQGSSVFLDISVANKFNYDSRFLLKINQTFNGSEKVVPIDSGYYSLTGTAPKLFNDFPLPSSEWEVGAHEIKVVADLIGQVDGSKIEHIEKFTIVIAESSENPIITNLKILTLTSTSALISWETNIPTDSKINYGQGSTTNQNTYEASLTKTHSLKLSGLSPSTTYSYFVKSCTKGNACITSKSQTFTTPADNLAMCEKSNYCKTQTSYVEFTDQNGTCREGNVVNCAASGCFKPSCDKSIGGCVGGVDLTKCQDVCASDMLKTNALCMPSDSDKLNGVCIYREMPCNELNYCDKISQACGGKTYYCIKSAGKYAWETTNSKCDSSGSGLSDIPDLDPSTTSEKLIPAGFLNDKLGEFASDLLKEVQKGEANAIDATFETDPATIKESDPVLLHLSTTSKSQITNYVCSPPFESASTCDCAPFSDAKAHDLKCKITPPSTGKYLITVLNSQKQSGTFAIVLENLKKASVFRVNVEDGANKDYFVVAMAIGGLLVFGAAISLLAKFREKKLSGKKFQRELEMIPIQREQLKARYMKGQIDMADFNAANAALDKRQVECEAALKTWEKKQSPLIPSDHPKSDEARIDELMQKTKTNNEEPTATDSKPQSGKTDDSKDKLDKLIDALKKKDGETN